MSLSDPDWVNPKPGMRLATIGELAPLIPGSAAKSYGIGGMLLLDGKYVVSLSSNKWRIKGKNKWYRHRGIDDFIARFYDGPLTELGLQLKVAKARSK